MGTCFSFKPNCFSGRFLFYFGDGNFPWPELKAWYLAHGLTDEHDRIGIAERSDADEYAAMVIDPCPAHPLILLRQVPHTPKEIGELVHEIHHAVQRFAGAIGMYTSRDSEEFFAYLEGCITEAVLEQLWHGKSLPGIEDVHR